MSTRFRQIAAHRFSKHKAQSLRGLEYLRLECLTFELFCRKGQALRIFRRQTNRHELHVRLHREEFRHGRLSL